MSGEPTAFLYPFIDGDERDPRPLLTDLATSARGKMAESRSLRASTIEGYAAALDHVAEAMAHRFRHGGRLFTFGNGGSATDADGAAELFRQPPRGRPLPALSLLDDPAMLTALGNDVGFELVFSRQLIALATAGDVTIGFSTSGGSVNVLAAFEEAHRRGVLTIGIAGYEGGAMATSTHVEHCFVVRSDSVHRIQESQAALLAELWSAVQRWLSEGSAA